MEQGTGTDTGTDVTGWVGWITFAGVMLIIVGVLEAIYGLIAIVNDDWVVLGNNGSVFLDLTAWGWIHLIIGVIVALVGLGVMAGNIIARILGVAIAAISLIANFLALPIYPVWAIVLITIDVLVIWALVVHGAEAKRA